MKLSVVISTRNRSESLTRTLSSVSAIADEIIVVDNESTDDTGGVAKKFKATVFRRKNNLMLNVNKNFGFSKARGEWILSLDDDEEIPPDLASEISQAIAGHGVSGYWIPRKNIIFGRWIRHGIWWPDRQLRLFKRGSGTFPERHVHEYVDVTGPTETLTHPYVHHNYDSLGQYLTKMQDIYTESEVAKYKATGYRLHWADAVRFPVSDFLKIYFAQGGYRDGLHGLVLSMLQAFYAFLIFVKLWERDGFPDIPVPLTDANRQLDRAGAETRYWMTTAELSGIQNPIAKTILRIKRKLGL